MENSEPKVIISSDMNRENRVPPGQIITSKWPIFSFHGTPEIDFEKWEFRIFGLVEEEVRWNYTEFRNLPVTKVHSDWHCVTTWSKLDMLWTGITARDVMEHIKPKPEAKAVMIHCYDGYTTNLLLKDFIEDDVVFAWGEGEGNLKPEQGYPLRLVVPKLYAWKSAKWANGIEFIPEDRPGFWEQNGYHMHGDPWTEERYS